MTIVYIFLGLLPGFIHKFIRRLIPGNTISSGATLSFANFVFCKRICIADGASLKMFVFIKAEKFSLGKHSKISSMVFANTRKIIIGEGVVLSSLIFIRSEWLSSSELSIGDHCSIFPLTWIEPGYGVTIGNNVGIGGFNLIFTHGSWPDFIQGGPVKFGRVEIRDNVWLPWRVFILPQVSIGANSIISGNSLISKSIPANSFAGGSPAKIIKENIYNLDEDMSVKKERLHRLIKEFQLYIQVNLKQQTHLDGMNLVGESFRILIDPFTSISKKGDLIIFFESSPSEIVKCNYIDYPNRTIYFLFQDNTHTKFFQFLRRYGVRLYQK